MSLSLVRRRNFGFGRRIGLREINSRSNDYAALRADGGQIFFDGKDITQADEKSLKPVRKQMQMIFQDPFAALDPRLTVEQIICGTA